MWPVQPGSSLILPILTAIHAGGGGLITGVLRQYCHDPRRPEIGVSIAFSLVELNPWIGWNHLEVEGSRLHNLLFSVGQPCEAIGEGVSD
ncbi:MAG: hypothetical protein O2857_11655 [Planctomycetota bacterium]|nr:hypothetical protein [Planctomycetota bacterium]